MSVPETTIRTSHAITIRAGGFTIGQIQNWAPSQFRAVNPLYEIDAVGVGNPVEQIPSTASNLTIQVSRYDLYTAKMEEVWGTPNALWMLTDQHNPIDIEEKWIRYKGKDLKTPYGAVIKSVANPVGSFMSRKSANAVNKIGEARTALINRTGLSQEKIEEIETGIGEISIEKWWYSGCWFSQIGRNIQAQGDRIVMVNATLSYTKVRPI